MDKHLYNGILFNDKEELFKNYLKELLSGATIWITLKYILLRDRKHNTVNTRLAPSLAEARSQTRSPTGRSQEPLRGKQTPRGRFPTIMTLKKP